MLASDWLWLVVVAVLAGGWFLTAQSKAQLEARYEASYANTQPLPSYSQCAIASEGC